MDDRRFDRLACALGAASTRRGALAALAGVFAGGAALDAEARRKRGTRRDDAPHSAGKRRNKKRCKPECTGNFSCVKQQCVCETAPCGGACCAVGQVCQRGRCAGATETFCHDLAEACGDGTPCCDGLQCSSGQGGGPVACWPVPGGECESDAECAYGAHCANGACVTDPVCTPTTCAAAGAECGSVPDGCGETLQCGGCPGAQTCGGAGAANACGCAPVSCTGGKSQDPASCQCVCPSGETDCAGTCIDLQSDAANCGTCSTACTGTATCQAGTCTCSGSLAYCGACVDTQTSSSHCGGCGNACTGGKTCQSGACACSSYASTVCDGTCVNLQSDDANCGTCGVSCNSGKTCQAGACATPQNVASFGTYGTATGAADGLLAQPHGVAVLPDGSGALVTDRDNGRVTLWTRAGTTWSPAGSFGTTRTTETLGQTDGTLSAPLGIALDAAGTTAWISDANNARIVVWHNTAGTWSHIASFGASGNATGPTDGKLSYPWGLAVDAAGTTAWVADFSSNRVTVWQLGGGTWSHVASFGTLGTTGLGQNDGKMKYPMGVAVDAAGSTAFVADGNNNRITRWGKVSGTWTHTASFGTSGAPTGPTDGKIKFPDGLATNAAGTTVWVVDDNQRMTVWNLLAGTWTHTASLGTPGTATGPTDGKLDTPLGVAVDAAGAAALIVDFKSDRVTVWAI